MKLFGGLGNAAAVLSGDTLGSISGPSRDPEAGVIEQTSGRFSVCPGNETKKAAANENIRVCLGIRSKRGALEQGFGFRRVRRVSRTRMNRSA